MHVRSALFAALLLATRICAESNFCSIEAWKSAIDESCKSNGTEVARELILNASPCNSSPEFNKELRIFTPELYLNQTLQTRPFQGLETDGNSLSIVIVSGLHTNTVSASDELHHDIVSYYDGFVTEAEVLPEFALVDVVAPLDKAIISEPELNWFRISRFYRGFSATHSTRVYGVPLGGAGVFTFYRQDLFQKHHLTIPTTWQALLETATAWSAAPPEPGISPFCMSRSSYCARTVLLSIAAPYMQAFGTRDGFLIDPANGTVLLNSTGFKVALQTWQQLAALSTVDASCGTGSDHFTDGGCLMTVQLFEKFKVYASNTSGVSSKLGVALPPGSSSVMNRTTGKMEPCTYTSCPYARCALQQEDLTLGGGGSGSGSHGGDVSQLFNSAPFMWGGLVGMVSARNPARIQTQVLEYFSNLTSNRSLDNVLRKGSHIAPFRADHWSPAARRNWTDAGYVEAAVEQMLDVLRRLHACANVAPHLRLPGQEDVSRMLSSALANLTAGQTLEVVTATLQVSVEATLLARYGMVNGTYGFLGLYRQQLGYVESSSTDVPLPPDHGGTRGVSRQSVVVIAVVVGLVVLLGAVVVLEVRNKRRHKDLLGRVKPPLGDPDTTIVVTSIQDFDELWEVLNSDASERALQQFSDLMDSLLQRYSGYRRAPSEEEEDVVAAFHCPRDACEFALELQRRLLHLRWPKHVLEMKQFRPQYLAQTNRAASFNQGYNAARVPMPPLAGSMPTEDDDKLFTLNTTENVRSFGEQCVASWAPADATAPDAELVFCGIRARVGVCAVGFSQLALDVDPGRNCVFFIGEAVEVATAAAAAAQGGMVLIPQSTFRQLHLEVLAEQCLFCHLGEYQLTAELPPMDLYLALDRQLLGRLALFGPLSCHMQWSQGAFAAPVHSASMVFTHVVGVQTLLAWNYDLMQDVIETFTKLAQVELQQAGGYLVEHVEGFMLTAFHSPADAILWGLRMQELMLKEDWPEELLAHELCEEVTVTVPVRGGDVTSATVFRGPRLKTGIDIGHVLARLHTMTGRMTYRGKVMNRAARISAAASSGQVLCSSEAWESCTASASALRLVSATSLGLFQLKGIQERIEVFHCTYQRHALSSTRRSSTVSVGLVSSSDNRRKSAVVLSSMSHASHHTTTYRTSLHNSVALEHVSASDTTGGRRGSQASSATLVGRGSLGGGQLSDMLHTVVADPDRTNASSVGPGPVLTTVTTNALRHRMALGPVLVGGADNVTASPGLASQTGSSHRSQGSGGAPANAPAPHAALAAVLQSRTRSASALQASNRVVPLRSASARTRRPLRLSSGAVASEPQVSLAAGASVPPALAAMKWNAGVAAPLSAMPSLAMAAAAAAAAAQERSNNNNSTNSPKHATALDLPRCVNGNGNMLDSASTLSNFGAVSGGANTESAATVTAAVYAVLPSVVLSGGVLGSSSGLSPAAHAYTHAIPISAVTTSLLDGCPRPGERLCSSGGGGCPASAASGGDGESEQDLHTVATIAAFVDSALQDRDRASIGAVPAVDGSQLVTKLQPRSQQRHPQQHQQQASSPFQFELVSSLEPLDENSPPVEDLGNAEKFADDADGNDGEDGMLDEGSRVETLEVTVSATGILRGALSGAASSSGFGGALGSSHGASPCAPISRCGSGTAGMSYLALGLSGGLGSIPGGITTTAGAGSHTSSCGSSGYGHVTYAHGQVTAARPQSAAIWRPSMSPAPHGISQGLAAVVESATGRHSGFASSADLFLPFPLGASSGGAVAGATNSTSSSMIATIRLGSPANGAEVRSGSTSSSANSPKHRPALDGVAVSMAPTSSSPMAMPQRHLASVHSSRLAGVAASAAAQLTAAGVAGRTSSYAGAGAACGRQAMGLQTTGAVPAMVDTTDARASAAVLPPADGAISTAAADADADADAKPTIFRVRAVTFDHNGSGDICGSMVGSVPENRFNRSYVTVTAAAAASSPVAMTSTASGRDGDNNCAGVGGGSSSGGRLRPNNRTGSCVSNDLISQAVSPASTWASGGSAGSATTNTTTINTTLAGAASISPAAASCASLDHSLQTRKLQLTQLQPQQQHPGTNTLRALLEGVGIGVTTGPGFDGSVMLPEFQRAKIRDDDVRAMKPRCSFIESQLGLRAADSSAEGGSCGGTDSVGANAAAAMAAVFGIEPPPCNEYTAAAVFGVGPPLNNFDDNAGSINVGGPTREQLERALELLGESRHAGGGEWR